MNTKSEFRGAPKRTPGAATIARGKARGIWDSDSDEDDADGEFPEGMSPPKTMQFHIPQSKLLRTPGECAPFELGLVLTFIFTDVFRSLQHAKQVNA